MRSLDSYPKRDCTCGHHEVMVADFYPRHSHRICVLCYRVQERERQRAYRGGRERKARRQARSAIRDRLAHDPEIQAALGVLRDAKAQLRERPGYVYCIAQRRMVGQLAAALDAVKVGYSVNPEARVAELQTGNPSTLYLLAKRPGTIEDEAELHARYAHRNILGEWFRPTKALLSEFA